MRIYRGRTSFLLQQPVYGPAQLIDPKGKVQVNDPRVQVGTEWPIRNDYQGNMADASNQRSSSQGYNWLARR